MLETFGQRLRQAREEKKMSAYKLSQKSGVNKQTIYNYELAGQFPNLYTAVCLADALGVSLDWLTGRDENG